MQRNVVLFATGQHVPNLLGVHGALEEGRIDRLICVASDAFRTKDRAKPNRDECFRLALELCEASRALAERMEIVLLPTADYEGTCKVLREVRDSDPQAHWIVNVSGGLKVMGIAAVDVFRGAKSAELWYMEAESTTKPLVLTGTSQRRWERAIAHKISIAEYLQGYGFQIENCDSLPKEKERVSACADLTQWLFRNRRESWVWTTIRTLDEWAEKQPKNGFPDRNKAVQLPPQTGWSVPEPTWRSLLARTFGGLEDNDGRLYGRLDKHAHKYLAGGWLEHWSFDTIRACQAHLGSLNDLSTSVRVKSFGAAKDEEHSNEFDVAFMLGTEFWVIECKSGAQSHKQGVEDSAMDDALYKLETIRANLGGLQAKSAILYTEASVREAMKKRAKAYGCALIGPDQLTRWHELREKQELEELAQAVLRDLKN